MMLKVRALSSEGRMTARMLTVLPVVTFVVLFLLNPRFYLDVADDPLFVPGFLALVVLYLHRLLDDPPHGRSEGVSDVEPVHPRSTDAHRAAAAAVPGRGRRAPIW